MARLLSDMTNSGAKLVVLDMNIHKLVTHLAWTENHEPEVHVSFFHRRKVRRIWRETVEALKSLIQIAIETTVNGCILNDDLEKARLNYRLIDYCPIEGFKSRWDVDWSQRNRDTHKFVDMVRAASHVIYDLRDIGEV